MIWYDVEHQNGAVVQKRLSADRDLLGFVDVIQIWSYLKPGCEVTQF